MATNHNKFWSILITPFLSEAARDLLWSTWMVMWRGSAEKKFNEAAAFRDRAIENRLRLVRYNLTSELGCT
jgi:hypothetical protein